LSYINQKKLKGEGLGIKITIDAIGKNNSTNELINKINVLNNNKSVNAIIVQRPMPKQINEEKIANAVIAQKDIDGFNVNSLFATPVALAVITILKRIHELSKINGDFNNWLKEKNILVIGKGITAGTPIIKYLQKLGIKVNTIDSKTGKKQEVLKNSDIIISAVGKENVVRGLDIKEGVILVDVGMHREKDGKFHGDYKEEEIENKASFYTPTPGGVGPINVAILMKNLVKATERSIDN
jgi:methylenetetrahydrofolate dehydrogenase (NADP+)/methenyltetrahydrofolate cyclohydrolase